MSTVVTLIPGDGIGPEVARAAVRLLEAAGAGIQWEEQEARSIVGHRHDDAQVDPLLESLGRRSEEHTSELQSRLHLVCRLLLEKKNRRGQRHPCREQH